MGTISERILKDGTKSYTAQIRIKRNGALVHSEAQTFSKRRAADAWLKKRETDLADPATFERIKRPDVTLALAIERYIDESRKEIGKTKAQVLAAIKAHDIGSKLCGAITSADIVSYAKELNDSRDPSTVGNYLSHLSSVFTVAKPAWEYPLDRTAMDDALVVSRKLGLVARSKQRERRPTLDELDKLLTYFADRKRRVPQSMPMHVVIMFAIFSTRRLEEITRICRDDYEPDNGRILVRDMKHPGEKIGNDVWCDVPPAAMTVINCMTSKRPEIFPYNASTITTNFTRACKLLGIDDLHFHDLRHDGISRLFEMGATIPQAAVVSGHKSWQSLKRYAHIRQSGDKYANWKWLKLIGGGASGNQ